MALQIKKSEKTKRARAKAAPAEKQSKNKQGTKPEGLAPASWGVRPGSRKDSVADAFAREGAEVATALAKELGLKASTVKSWIGHWRRLDAKTEGQS